MQVKKQVFGSLEDAVESAKARIGEGYRNIAISFAETARGRRVGLMEGQIEVRYWK